MEDKTILDRITALVDEEHRLRENPAAPEANAERLKSVAEQLDQCWDLLRQRRAKREFGADPESAARHRHGGELHELSRGPART